MKSKGILIVVGVVLAVGMLIPDLGCNTVFAQTISLKVSAHHTQTNPYVVLLEKAMDLIQKRYSGTIKYEYHPAKSLYNLKKGSEAVMDGLVDIASFKAGYFLQKFGLVADIANMPYNYPFDAFAQHSRDQGGFFEWASAAYERNGVKLLSTPVATPLGIITTKPVRKLEDMKGMLMRCVPGAAAKGFELLGAEPVFISSGEIYEGLLRGTIDGSNTSIVSAASTKLYEAAKYYTLCDYTTTGIEYAINTRRYKSLPADLQKIVGEAFEEAEREFFKSIPAVTGRDRKVMENAGVEFITLDKAELARWQAAMEALYKQMAAKYGADWERFTKIRNELQK